jgi:toxin ParE1/3/4
MPQVSRRAAARRDLVDHYVYPAENTGEETADRFLVLTLHDVWHLD